MVLRVASVCCAEGAGELAGQAGPDEARELCREAARDLDGLAPLLRRLARETTAQLGCASRPA